MTTVASHPRRSPPPSASQQHPTSARGGRPSHPRSSPISSQSHSTPRSPVLTSLATSAECARLLGGKLRPNEQQQIDKVRELKPDWDAEKVVNFCKRLGFEDAAISHELTAEFEFERPSHSSAAEDWVEIPKKEAKKKTATAATAGAAAAGAAESNSERKAGAPAGSPVAGKFQDKKAGKPNGAPRESPRGPAQPFKLSPAAERAYQKMVAKQRQEEERKKAEKAAEVVLPVPGKTYASAFIQKDRPTPQASPSPPPANAATKAAEKSEAKTATAAEEKTAEKAAEKSAAASTTTAATGATAEKPAKGPATARLAAHPPKAAPSASASEESGAAAAPASTQTPAASASPAASPSSSPAAGEKKPEKKWRQKVTPPTQATTTPATTTTTSEASNTTASAADLVAPTASLAITPSSPALASQPAPAATQQQSASKQTPSTTAAPSTTTPATTTSTAAAAPAALSRVHDLLHSDKKVLLPQHLQSVQSTATFQFGAARGTGPRAPAPKPAPQPAAAAPAQPTQPAAQPQATAAAPPQQQAQQAQAQQAVQQPTQPQAQAAAVQQPVGAFAAQSNAIGTSAPIRSQPAPIGSKPLQAAHLEATLTGAAAAQQAQTASGDSDIIAAGHAAPSHHFGAQLHHEEEAHGLGGTTGHAADSHAPSTGYGHDQTAAYSGFAHGAHDALSGAGYDPMHHPDYSHQQHTDESGYYGAYGFGAGTFGGAGYDHRKGRAQQGQQRGVQGQYNQQQQQQQRGGLKGPAGQQGLGQQAQMVGQGSSRVAGVNALAGNKPQQQGAGASGPQQQGQPQGSQQQQQGSQQQHRPVGAPSSGFPQQQQHQGQPAGQQQAAFKQHQQSYSNPSQFQPVGGATGFNQSKQLSGQQGGFGGKVSGGQQYGQKQYGGKPNNGGQNANQQTPYYQPTAAAGYYPGAQYSQYVPTYAGYGYNPAFSQYPYQAPGAAFAPPPAHAHPQRGHYGNNYANYQYPGHVAGQISPTYPDFQQGVAAYEEHSKQIYGAASNPPNAAAAAAAGHAAPNVNQTGGTGNIGNDGQPLLQQSNTQQTQAAGYDQSASWPQHDALVNKPKSSDANADLSATRGMGGYGNTAGFGTAPALAGVQQGFPGFHQQQQQPAHIMPQQHTAYTQDPQQRYPPSYNGWGQ